MFEQIDIVRWNQKRAKIEITHEIIRNNTSTKQRAELRRRARRQPNINNLFLGRLKKKKSYLRLKIEQTNCERKLYFKSAKECKEQKCKGRV